MPKVEVPEKLWERLSERSEEKGFANTEDYIVDILEQVARKLRTKKGKKQGFSEEEEEKVKDRLRGLGYLD